MVRLFLILALCLAVHACVSAPRNAQPQAAEDPVAALERRIGTLSPQKLEEGACGLFLWARATRAKLVFFSESDMHEALMALDDKEARLLRTNAEGRAVFGQHERQRFLVDDLTVELNISPEMRSGIVGGAVIKQGIIRLAQADGWEYVLPVAGMIACQAS